MKELFRITIADTVTLNDKLKKFDSEDWAEQYSDEIFDKMYDSGYDLSESVDYDMAEKSITFYFLTSNTVNLCEIDSDRRYPMRADEMFIGSLKFEEEIKKSEYADIFAERESLEITNVTHDDMEERVIYDIRKLTNKGGKHEDIELTDEYIIECIKKNDDDGVVLGSNELSGGMAMELSEE